ncbi:MAG: Gfo/Idh/MocA family oxidoreductase [Chloroflexi bacterium]|nr:Gfo/Idh/MocA family oxidoreductase [Chloroflexota bacterium]
MAGVGWLGESLIKDIGAAPSLQLVAVQDVRLDRARSVADQYACSLATDSFDELLEHPTVDAVAICTPNALHVPQARQALAAGKHVLVQKPLALAADDAASTVRLAQRQERLLFVDYTYRFLETTRLLQQHAGTIRSVKAAFHNIYGPGTEKAWFFDAKLSGGGALIDLGVHLLDLALWLLQPASVELTDARLENAPIDTAAHLRLRCDQMPVDVEVSWNAATPLTEISVELETDNGRWCWENVDGSFFRFRTRRDTEILLDRETSLRSDTLCAFERALKTGNAPTTDVRVYELLEQAYRQAV